MDIARGYNLQRLILFWLIGTQIECYQLWMIKPVIAPNKCYTYNSQCSSHGPQAEALHTFWSKMNKIVGNAHPINQQKGYQQVNNKNEISKPNKTNHLCNGLRHSISENHGAQHH